MSLKIRLSRAGAKKRPYYRVVLADARSPRDGRYLERLGSYNPMLPKDSDQRVQLNEDRIRYWLGQGAQPTDRVAKFLGHAKIRPMPEIREQTKKSQPKQKTLDRLAEQEEKAKAAAEAAVEADAAAEAEAAATAEAAAAEAEAPTEDTPAEEAPAEDAAAEETANNGDAKDDGEGKKPSE